jgi:hypothetical protein
VTASDVVLWRVWLEKTVRQCPIQGGETDVKVVLVDKFGLHRILRREGFATPVNSSGGSELVGRGQYASR